MGYGPFQATPSNVRAMKGDCETESISLKKHPHRFLKF
jgi:hypothetical protein